jgi:hypothetical protein
MVSALGQGWVVDRHAVVGPGRLAVAYEEQLHPPEHRELV